MRIRIRDFAVAGAVLGLFIADAPRTSAASLSSCSAAQCLTNDAVISRVDPNTPDNDKKGDYSFFSTSSTKMPNVVLMLDNSTSMYELPFDVNDYPNSSWVCQGSDVSAKTVGCLPNGKAGNTPVAKTDLTTSLGSCHVNPFFESLTFTPEATDTSPGPKYDKTRTYPLVDAAAFPNYFLSDHYYKWFDWSTVTPSHTGNNGTGTFDIGSHGGGTPAGTPTNACNNFDNITTGASGGGSFADPTNSSKTWNLTLRQRCQMCLDEAGYFIGPNATNNDSGPTTLTAAGNVSGNIVFKGNWLNFYPPKFMIARSVVAQTIQKQVGAKNPVRIAVVTYDNDSFGAQGYGASLAANDGGAFISKSGTLPALFPLACAATSWDATLDAKPLINQVNAIPFGVNQSGGTGNQFIVTPLAETVFNIGQFLGGTNDFYAGTFASGTWTKSSFTAPAQDLTGNAANGAPFCGLCQTNAIVVITDGNPHGDNNLPSCAASSTALGCQLTAHKVCGTTTAAATAACGVDENNAAHINLLADVTNFLQINDINKNAPGTQNVTTYVIGFGVKVPLLDLAASAGGSGSAKRADNAASLSSAINSFVANVISRSTSFSSSAIQTLQVGSGSTALVPRFLPSTNKIWEGHLFRFDLLNEFTAGVDKDHNGTRDGVFVVDKDGDIVTEDDAGNFIKSSGPSGGSLAVPIWDAGAVMQQMDLNARKLKTAISNGSGGWTTVDWPTQATKGDATFKAVRDAMDLAAPSPACAAIRAAMTAPIPAPYADTGTSVDGCAMALMDYIRGFNIFHDRADLLAAGTAQGVTDRRFQVLGDIFHSSPIVVEPPVDQFLCALGLDAQCVSTLFQDKLSPPVAFTPTANYGTTAAPIDAYEQYWQNGKTRERFVIAGANDFIVHAFDAGGPTSPFKINAPVQGLRQVDYGPGDGHELWGFITPDQLPRLWLITQGHQLSMDGDIMVRDVWVDGKANTLTGTVGVGDATADGTKQASEFHTIAIVSEREGGTHYTALDITNPTTPTMLWMYPPPCDQQDVQWGQSWSQFAPRPPPIGPVLLEKSGGPTRYGVQTEERWVAFLNGGHSPFNDRGRAVAMLDAFTGFPLFSANYDTSAGAFAPAKAMRFGFPATISMADYGEDDTTFQQDGFFDTAVVGDEGGQIWTFRFGVPGKRTGPSAPVNNWTYGRAFEPNTSNSDLAVSHQAIYTPTSLAVDVGGQNWLHAYVGSGDRAHLRSQNGGDCRPDDPLTCIESRCSGGILSRETIENGPTFYDSSFTGSDAGTISGVTQAYDGGTGAACDHVKVTQTMGANPCLPDPAQVLTYSQEIADGGVVDNSYPVPEEGNRGLATDAGPSLTAPFVQQNNFVNVVVFSGAAKPDNVNNVRTMKSTTTVDAAGATYDTGRLSLINSTPTTPALVDLTSVTSFTVGGTSSTSASSTSGGWVVKYTNGPDEKTVTGAAVLGGCVIWNTLLPQNGESVSACASVGDNLASFYQADAVTGLPNCAAAFLNNNVYARVSTRNVISPPPEPAAAIAIGAGGSGERFSTLEIQPTTKGQKEVTQMTVGTTNDILQMIYSVPLTSDQHDCRHSSAAKCN